VKSSGSGISQSRKKIIGKAYPVGLRLETKVSSLAERLKSGFSHTGNFSLKINKNLGHS
jgi:hypothetical protein